MGVVTGGGGAAFNGGTITRPLVISDAAASGDPLYLRDPTDIDPHGVDMHGPGIAGQGGSWQVSVWTKGVNAALFLENDNLIAPGTSDLIEAANNGGDVFRVLNDGAVVTGQVAAPASALLNAGQVALWFDPTNGAAALGQKAKTADGTVVTGKYPLRQSSGSLATTTFSSGTGKQVSTTQDVYLVVPCTLNPTAGAAGTVAVALSPDNVTYSALATITEPAGIALDGTIIPASLQVPAGWYVKLTATNATIGTGTYY